jgi:two-component system, sensor histidine kinase PdtaS
MASLVRPHPAAPRGGAALPWLARLPTGAKLFLLLSVGLLPLALIAITATLQTTRAADADKLARLQVVSSESAHVIAAELVADMTALNAAAHALARAPDDAASCALAQLVFDQRPAGRARFAIADRSGRVLCGAALPAVAPVARGPRDAIETTIVPGQGLLLALPLSRTGFTAHAFFPSAMLARLARPVSQSITFSRSLTAGDASLALDPLPNSGPLDRLERVRTALGIDGLVLNTTVRRAPVTSSLIVALLLPLLMWAAAAGIAWLVVDRLLIRPLRRLRASVAAFTPGEVIDVGATGPLPAAELRELGDTFRAISRTVAIHEAGLADGLVRQTKLTREVHHRVKNNLQVISSLINFHARGAQSADATAAYASIQRRVDALAVVHRNHFAEMEDNRGLNLRTLIGELAANIRATAPAESHGLGITLEIEPLLVNQDIGVAVAFLVTETVELAMSCDPKAQIRVALRAIDDGDRATLRVVSRALIDTDELRELAETRYARVMEGLARQLRARLHHDPLTGAYEIELGIVGRA